MVPLSHMAHLDLGTADVCKPVPRRASMSSVNPAHKRPETYHSDLCISEERRPRFAAYISAISCTHTAAPARSSSFVSRIESSPNSVSTADAER
jgi:hypothetical protein